MFPLPLLPLAPPSVVGTWVPALPAKSLLPQERGVAVTFAKDGTVHLTSAAVRGVGTYRVQGDTVTLTLARRNGSVPSNPAERRATLRLADGGKTLLMSTGRRQKGMDVLLRLVRRR